MAINEDNREIIEEFVAESADALGEIEAILIEMESGVCVASEDQLNLIFRAFHSVKGTAGFLELERVVSVTHLAESLLDQLRKGMMELQPVHVTLFLRAMDCVNRALEEIAAEGTDTCIEPLVGDVCAAIEVELGSADATTSAAAAEATPAETVPEPVQAAETEEHDVSEPPSAKDDAWEDDSNSDSDADSNWDDDDEFEQELIEEFVTDSLELIDSVDATLAQARGELAGQEACRKALRGLRVIKGNCGFLGFFDLGELCHATEAALGRVADGKNRSLDPLFAAVHALRTGIAELPKGGRGHVPRLQGLLKALRTGQMPETNAAAQAPKPALEAVSKLSEVDTIDRVGPMEAVPEPKDETAQRAAATVVEAEAVPPIAAVPTPKPGNDAAPATSSSSNSSARQSIRVDTGKLDELMNLVGELIIAENMVTHNEDLEGHDFESFHKAALHLNRITRSLQDLTMSVRMVPIRPTFRKMLRVARDVAQKQGKDVELVLKGEDTEVDRSVVESIGDPLVHLLRNAVDHGIEDREQRTALGKPSKGNLSLTANHEGGEVWVTLSDDGKGLNRDAILNKAISKGIVMNGDDLSDSDVYQLICEPGFSTAAVVSDISGRGVGMDVVKRNIEKLRGRLEISSEPGKGTTFTMRIPLTLAIVEGMQVAVGEHNYTIPLFSIRESVSVENASVSTLTDGSDVLDLRGEFIPVVRVSDVHGVIPHATTWDEGVFVIVNDGGVCMALFVDEIVGQRQTVVKPLPKYLGPLRGLAGCSILSTGSISLVIDVQSLTERVRMAA